ncbi:MAG: ABC transporter substrate-binding protein [Methanotrichaceae archaeon]
MMKLMFRELLAALICIMLTVCSVGFAEQQYPMTIKDSAGRVVTLQMPVQRIIVCNSDAAEAVLMLGAGDKIVGVADTVKSKGFYFPTLKNKQSVGTFTALDYEMMGAIAKQGDMIVPDIIVIGYTYPGKSYGIDATAKALVPFKNITCIGLDFYQPENMTEEMKLLGTILNKETEAQDYINWYNERTANIQKAVSGASTPKVYVEWSAKGNDLSAMGPKSGAGAMLSAVNCFNIVSKLSDPYPVVNWEYVIAQKPDIMIVRQTLPSNAKAIGWAAPPSSDALGLEKSVNAIKDRAAASSVPAVKNNKVYIFDWDFMAGPDQVVGLTYLAKVIHPEADLDPESVYKEYLQLLGLGWTKDRIFVYPDIISKK